MSTIMNTAAFPNEYQTFYSDRLLDHAEPLLVMDQFATREAFPKNMDAKTMRFFKKRVAAVTDILGLSEGVSPTTSQYSTIADLGYVEATLKQYGEITAETDILSWTSKIKLLKEMIETMGEDCALHADAVIRNAIISKNITDAVTRTKRYAGGASSFATLAALDQTTGRLVAQDVLDMFTDLKLLRCPQVKGGYVWIVPPQISRDLMNDAKWLNVTAYSAPEQQFKGEAGKFFGCRVVEHTNPFIEDGTDAEGTDHGAAQLDSVGVPIGSPAAAATSANAIFPSFATGKGAYACPIMAGKSPFSPRIAVLDKADKSDPFNQRTIAGWTAYWTAILYQSNWLVVFRSKSGYGV